MAGADPRTLTFVTGRVVARCGPVGSAADAEATAPERTVACADLAPLLCTPNVVQLVSAGHGYDREA